MQTSFLFIFTIFWSAITVMFDVMIIHGTYLQYQSQHYQSVQGRVTHSEVKSHRSSKGSTSYSAEITYHYAVNGQEYNGDRLRYNSISSGHASAGNLVYAHPVNSSVQVFYNPADPQECLLFPGVEGRDFMLALFMTPFNMVMFGFWVASGAWMRERWFRPVAGGVKIIRDGTFVRVRLPQFAACWWGLGTTGGLGFILTFIVGFGTDMQPSLSTAAVTVSSIYIAGFIIYLWQWQKINSGIDDLVINQGAHTLDLPKTYNRKAPFTVNLADVTIITIEKITHTSSKGGVSYTYAPTLCLRGTHQGTQKLADWSDQLKAGDFAKWLSEQLNIPLRVPEMT